MTTKSPFASNVLRARVFSISAYFVLSILSVITPALTLDSSTKDVPNTESNVCFASVKLNFKRSAPAAFSFDVPAALSSKESSAADVTKDSTISRPTLYEGAPLYFSNIIVCLSTFVKNPLVNTTPSVISAIDALPVGVSEEGCISKSFSVDVSVVTAVSYTHLTLPTTD